MSPEDFKNIWTKDGDTVSPLAASKIAGLRLMPSTMEFLTISGLPIDPSPYLSFVQDSDEKRYGINILTDQYDFLESEYEKFVVIGSCNNGDPIVINTDKDDRIEVLNHEDFFSSQFFNSSIMTMAECLLIYRDFVFTVLKENGEEAILDSNFTDEQFEELRHKIEIADPKALTEDGFWKEQLEMELLLREDMRNEK